ncbi:MAG: hypothetical protein ACREEP_21870 [Dongiaceae bacterium]
MAITHLERRKIEAGVPMVKAFQRAFGKIALEVIRELARENDSRRAAQFGHDLASLQKVAELRHGLPAIT